jgi:hypothetical protein
MVSFRSFVTLVLAGMAVASPLKRELEMEGDSATRDRVFCADSSQSKFISAS